MQGRSLLDVVVLKSATVVELLTREDKTLLITWDTLLVPDLGLDSLDGVGALGLDGDGLTRQCLDKNLHVVVVDVVVGLCDVTDVLFVVLSDMFLDFIGAAWHD